jgi:hypothetical protein
MYQAQMEWSPQIAEQQMGMFQQYMPQVMQMQQGLMEQYAPQQAALQQQLQQQYEPEAYAAREQLGGLMEQGDWMTGYQAQTAPGMEAARDRLTQDVRGAWAQRGLGQSGMSAEDEMRMLSEFEFPYAMQQEQMTLQELARRQNVGLALTGRAQAQGMPQVGMPQYQPPDVMGGYSFPQVQGGMMQGYGTYAPLTRPMIYQQDSGLGGILGGAGAGMSGLAAMKTAGMFI